MSDERLNEIPVEPRRPRRRSSILKQNSDEHVIPHSRSVSPKARRNSLKESDMRIASAPIVFNSSFENVQVDESEPAMVRRSSEKRLGLSSVKNLDDNSVEDLVFYRPRRESLLLLDDAKIQEGEDIKLNASPTNENGVTSSISRTESTDSLSNEDQVGIQQFISKFVGRRHSTAAIPTTAKPSTPVRPERKRVSFATVQISEHPCIVGDNPSVSSGVPLAIDWNSSHSESISLDKYEELRRNDRRFLHELKVPSDVRWERLKNFGASSEEIAMGILASDKTRHERIQTYRTLHKAQKEERKENFRRGLKNIFTNQKRKENKYIEHAMSFDS